MIGLVGLVGFLSGSSSSRGNSARQAQLRSLVDQSAWSRRAAELARIPCREGGVDVLALPHAECTLLIDGDALSVAETNADIGVVAIYKSPGSG